MALTEPQAGSDLGRLSTRAEGQSDGSLRITGSKIFISGADHDLTEQIVHLVLCRFADAPPGSRGLSLALVPKWLPHGSRNAWAVTGLEHKMGIHGSATCAVAYDGATGWRVGEPNGGLAAMFLMMNSARLHVGLQGLGHQEMATQTALAYAFDRVQGGRVVAEHAAVRKILLRLQSLTEAQRVIAYRAALAIDEAEHHPSAARRAEQKRIAGLLTPLVKAYCTAQGFQGASEALQVLGGYGYLRDYGLEQSLRDVRIAMVYEGTNEIQAIDLVKRKLLGDGGEGLGLLLAEFEADAQRCLGAPGLDDFGTALQTQMAAAHASLEALGAQARNDPEAPLRLADEMLQGMAHLLLAWAWARSAWATQALADRAWAEAKLARMRFGIEWLLPQAEVHWARVQSGGSALPLPALPDRS
jgi:alkylation response protein AidB-like acyl-CoA dehydrogenase